MSLVVRTQAQAQAQAQANAQGDKINTFKVTPTLGMFLWYYH